MWRQWQRISNYIHSIQTYQDMSPDVSQRRQVNQILQKRPSLSPKDWCAEFKLDAPMQADRLPDVLLFMQRSLAAHSGLEFARVRPQDRLVEDLHFPLVCWFDWSTRFCDDVLNQWQVDIGDCFDETRIYTVADLANFLAVALAPSP